MKKVCLLLFILITTKNVAQEINVLLKQALNYERALKEDSALLKYKTILAADSLNVTALIKISLLNASNSARQTAVISKHELLNTAKY